MKKRKRAPGGGRKPEGEFRNLTAVMSLRMPQDLRDRLERARVASRRSLSQELIARAEASFERDRDQSRDRASRAFFFLFSELMQAICITPKLMTDWRFDPWLFQAFKLAVGQLLDRFQPEGEMKLPETWQFIRDAPDAKGYRSNKEMRELMTDSPEAMAYSAVTKVWSDFADPRRVESRYEDFKGLESQINPALDYQIREWRATHYDMPKARRDLAPRQKSHGGKQ